LARENPIIKISARMLQTSTMHKISKMTGMAIIIEVIKSLRPESFRSKIAPAKGPMVLATK
jgi:hypothetical protein